PGPAPSPDEAESWVDEPPPEIHDAPPAQEQARADESEERVDPAVLLPDDQAFGPGEAAWFDSELPGVVDTRDSSKRSWPSSKTSGNAPAARRRSGATARPGCRSHRECRSHRRGGVSCPAGRGVIVSA